MGVPAGQLVYRSPGFPVVRLAGYRHPLSGEFATWRKANDDLLELDPLRQGFRPFIVLLHVFWASAAVPRHQLG